MMLLPYPHRQKQLQSLLHKLGLADFSRVSWQLLDQALTHPTASTEANYEQLEFIGDAVIRLAAAEFLLKHYSELPVGEFAAIRSMLVSDRTLARIAAKYDIDRYLLVANSALNDKLGEESRRAEAFEALLGVLYLSTHNLELVRPWLNPHLQELVIEIRDDPARQNYKAALQEWTQAQHKSLPEYRVNENTQAEASQRFIAEVWFNGTRLGQGTGRSIKAAEQAAAEVAFWSIRSQAQE